MADELKYRLFYRQGACKETRLLKYDSSLKTWTYNMRDDRRRVAGKAMEAARECVAVRVYRSHASQGAEE